MAFVKKWSMMQMVSLVKKDLVDYHIFRADEMPNIRSIFVQTTKRPVLSVRKRLLKFRWTALHRQLAMLF